MLQTPIKTLLFLTFAALSVYFLVALGGRAIQLVQMHQEGRQIEQALAMLQAREQRLIDDRDRLLQHQDIELIARRDLNLIKPGETAVIVYPAFAADPQPVAPEEPAKPQREPTWLERLLHLSF